MSYLARWWAWRKRRPHPENYLTKTDFRRNYAIWRDQKPRLK